ncbi:MAG TPA: tetratricopeptide repeat protein, partial [Geobacteraceae bacterium]
DYDVPFAETLATPAVAAAALGLGVLLGTAILARKRHPQILLGLGWFFLIMVPALNLFATNPIVADRYAYLPSFGFCYLLATLPQRFVPAGAKRFLVAAGFTLVAVWAGLAGARNGVWRSDKTLWEDTLKVSPASFRAYMNLGNVYLEEKDFPRAFALFKRAQELNPADATYDIYLGDALFEKGEYAGAITSYQAALRRNPNSLLALAQLGQAYEKTGQTELAIETYSKLVDSNEPEPNNVRHNDARLRRAFLYAGSGRDAEALRDYLHLERGGLNSWQLSCNIARSYARQGKRREAIAYYVRSLEKNGANADALNNLGILYREEKEYDNAIAVFRKAMTLDPAFPLAPFNLAVTFLDQGDRANARYYFSYTLERFPRLRASAAPFLAKLQ